MLERQINWGGLLLATTDIYIMDFRFIVMMYMNTILHIYIHVYTGGLANAIYYNY